LSEGARFGIISKKFGDRKKNAWKIDYVAGGPWGGDVFGGFGNDSKEGGASRWAANKLKRREKRVLSQAPKSCCRVHGYNNGNRENSGNPGNARSYRNKMHV